MSAVPVLTIDGPSGAGKGTISRALARRLGWHYLDSGAIYRTLALATLHAGVALDDEAAVARLAGQLDLVFQCNDELQIFLAGNDVSREILTEQCGKAASVIAALGSVRQALLQKQREFQELPGLVADGRDMGTVVFPDAAYKIFLTASPEARAERRYKQLKEKGLDVSLDKITIDLIERDSRDENRENAPLAKAEGAVVIDSSDLAIEEVMARVLALVSDA